jgi:hypothetical protein
MSGADAQALPDKPAVSHVLRRLIAMSPGFPCTGKATLDEYFTTEYFTIRIAD